MDTLLTWLSNQSLEWVIEGCTLRICLTTYMMLLSCVRHPLKPLKPLINSQLDVSWIIVKDVATVVAPLESIMRIKKDILVGSDIAQTFNLETILDLIHCFVCGELGSIDARGSNLLGKWLDFLLELIDQSPWAFKTLLSCHKRIQNMVMLISPVVSLDSAFMEPLCDLRVTHLEIIAVILQVFWKQTRVV